MSKLDIGPRIYRRAKQASVDPQFYCCNKDLAREWRSPGKKESQRVPFRG
jgi:hypothetical protein